MRADQFLRLAMRFCSNPDLVNLGCSHGYPFCRLSDCGLEVCSVDKTTGLATCTNINISDQMKLCALLGI